VHIILSTIGTAGDVYPFIGLGRALARRGYEVEFHGSDYFRDSIEQAGLPFVSIMSRQAHLQAIQNPDLWTARRGPVAFWQHALPVLREGFHRMAQAIRPGETVIVGHFMAFWTRLVQEKFGVPAATIIPQPIFSAEAPPVYQHMRWLGYLPAWSLRVLRWALESLVLGPLIRPSLNEFRASVGLPPLDRLTIRYFYSPDRVLCTVPEWYTPRPGDWPPNTVCTGFPQLDIHPAAALDPALLAFIAGGPPPIGATPGSGFGLTQASVFFERVIESCAALGRRAVLVTPFRDRLPATLPDFVHHAAYAPYELLMPRLAALLHAGGIGTTAQALAAGTPQLVTPFASDQFDNAAKIARLGGGLTIAHDAPTRKWVACLRALLDPGRFEPACAELARRMAEDESGTERMAYFVEQLRPPSARAIGAA
jgi:rhamnosyltransferase subunit B